MSPLYIKGVGSATTCLTADIILKLFPRYDDHNHDNDEHDDKCIVLVYTDHGNENDDGEYDDGDNDHDDGDHDDSDHDDEY